jgi:hypothetical protein
VPALEDLAQTLARKVPADVDTRTFVDESAALLDRETRARLVVLVESQRHGLGYSGTDRGDADDATAHLVGIGRIDVESLERQTAMLARISHEHRERGYGFDADDLRGAARLLGWLLYRAYRAQGFTDATAQDYRDALLAVPPAE